MTAWSQASNHPSDQNPLARNFGVVQSKSQAALRNPGFLLLAKESSQEGLKASHCVNAALVTGRALEGFVAAAPLPASARGRRDSGKSKARYEKRR
jgi:hypothetical protein